MKSETLVTTLTSLTTGMALAAPVVVFGFLYVLQVQPQRAAALEARDQLVVARGELNRRRLSSRPRVANADRVREITDALAAALKSPPVGAVSNLSIAIGAPADAHTPVTVTFDARYEQIGGFFWNLRGLPATFDLQSVDLSPVAAAPAGLTRATVSLLVFHRAEAMTPRHAPQRQMVDVATAPDWPRDPFTRQPRQSPPPR